MNINKQISNLVLLNKNRMSFKLMFNNLVFNSNDFVRVNLFYNNGFYYKINVVNNTFLIKYLNDVNCFKELKGVLEK